MRYELILRLPLDEELLAAIKAGARLRPKVMTVATAIAGLLPIFSSTRPGVEVMQPLAAPVFGGMLPLSSTSSSSPRSFSPGSANASFVAPRDWVDFTKTRPPRNHALSACIEESPNQVR